MLYIDNLWFFGDANFLSNFILWKWSRAISLCLFFVMLYIVHLEFFAPQLKSKLTSKKRERYHVGSLVGPKWSCCARPHSMLAAIFWSNTNETHYKSHLKVKLHFEKWPSSWSHIDDLRFSPNVKWRRGFNTQKCNVMRLKLRNSICKIDCATVTASLHYRGILTKFQPVYITKSTIFLDVGWARMVNHQVAKSLWLSHSDFVFQLETHHASAWSHCTLGLFCPYTRFFDFFGKSSKP